MREMLRGNMPGAWRTVDEDVDATRLAGGDDAFGRGRPMAVGEVMWSIDERGGCRRVRGLQRSADSMAMSERQGAGGSSISR